MPTKEKTIAQVLDEFLADHEAAGLSAKTISKYRSIIDLYRTYLESYWPDHDDDFDRVTKQGSTYCDTFGPEDILSGYSEFLGYFMPHKVMCGKDTMKAAGTVTKKLAKWVAEKGYIQDTDNAEERAAQAATDLPASQDVLELLDGYVDMNAPDQFTDEIEDHFWIKKIEPGKLWLEPLTAFDKVIGPVPVPKKVTQLCGEMWDISGVVVKTRQGWRLLEVWNVTP